MILDVGCGNTPKGDVNCDLYISDIFHHRSPPNSNLLIDLSATPNFILCDAHYLPFREGTFEKVYCQQVIEHCKDPYRIMRELSYVCSYRLTVETVHYLGESLIFNRKARYWFKKLHINKFNVKWFIRVAPSSGLVYLGSRIISWKVFPHPYFPIIHFPFEVGFDYQKRSS